jgi:TPR repeat protein
LKESFKWLLHAAAGGEPTAQARVSAYYRTGNGGVVDKNDEKAFHYAISSSRQCIAGLFELGLCWMFKTDPDAFEKAIGCLEKAAEFGYTMAMFALGDYYYLSVRRAE